MGNFVITPLEFSMIFLFIFNVFINLHEYENEIICISDRQVKVLCLEIKFDNKFSVVDRVAAKI